MQDVFQKKMQPIIKVDSDSEHTPGHGTFGHNGRSNNSIIAVEVLGDKHRARRNRLSPVPLPGLPAVSSSSVAASSAASFPTLEQPTMIMYR